MPDRYTDLIERLSSAREGSRELDADIWVATHDYKSSRQFWTWRSIQPRDHEPDHRSFLLAQAPHFTSSLDAALTLVPEGGFWRIGNDGEGPDPGEYRADVLDGIGLHSGTAVHSIPAVALCIASLRALQSMEAGNG